MSLSLTSGGELIWPFYGDWKRAGVGRRELDFDAHKGSKVGNNFPSTIVIIINKAFFRSKLRGNFSMSKHLSSLR
jgi:hypothetical protein